MPHSNRNPNASHILRIIKKRTYYRLFHNYYNLILIWNIIRKIGTNVSIFGFQQSPLSAWIDILFETNCKITFNNI